MDLLRESIQKNWNDVKYEQLNEGLDDHMAAIGRGIANAGRKIGVINPDRDEYRKLNKKNSLGADPYGSKAISAINLMGKILRGRKWQNYDGGYFTTQKRSYQDEKYQLEDKFSGAVNTIISKLFLARQLSQICEPTKISMFDIARKTSVQPDSNGNSDNYLQLVSDFSGNLKYGGNLMNGCIPADIDDVWNWKDSKVVADFIFHNVFNNQKTVPKKYQWMKKSLIKAINHAKIFRGTVNGFIGGIGKELDTIDSEINRIAWGRGYTNPRSFQSDPRIRQFAERKAYLVNSALDNLEEEARNKKFGNFSLANGKDPIAWFFNEQALADEIANYPRKTVNDFLEVY